MAPGGPRSLVQRRPRTPAPSEADVPTVRSADELDAVLADLPEHVEELRLRVESLDQVRLLTLADRSRTVERLVLEVVEWSRPLTRWSGRLGSLAQVVACSVAYPTREDDPTSSRPAPSGLVRIDLRVGVPTALSDVARGIYPLLGVQRRVPGYGHVELGTGDIPPAGLALLPTPTAPGVPDIPSEHLIGLGLSRADLGLVGTSETLASMQELVDDPEQITFADSLLVAPDGHLAVSERTAVPLIDLNVHNPVGRLHTFDEPEARLALTVADGVLTFAVLPERPRFQYADRRRAQQQDQEGDPGDRLTGWSRPAGAPVTGTEARRLREVEDLDLSGLRPGSEAEERQLYQRLAELAATGVILHSLPPTFLRVEDVLGSTLAASLRAPYTPGTGLVRELRTVPQRRDAMARFGGFFELAEHADRLGHRLLPSVSVVLSTMRPGRVADVLLALAAQTYPHLEIAVALHGADGPPGPAFEEAVRTSGAQVLSYERSVPFGSVLAETARRTSGDLVVKIDDDDFYGPRVIEDLVLGYLYSNADVVGKTTEYLYFEGIDNTAHRRFQTERYHTQVAGGAMMLSRAMLNEVGGWRPSHHSTDRSVLIRVGNSGGVCYRTQSLGYIYVRHSEGHTWKQMDSLLLRNAPEQWPRFLHEIVDA